jgi:hypothetical protein
VCAIDSVKAHPLSSSPVPVKVMFDPIPIGLPVVEWFTLDHERSVPPVTARSPAFAADTAREPQRADKPYFSLLFIYDSP